MEIEKEKMREILSIHPENLRVIIEAEKDTMIPIINKWERKGMFIIDFLGVNFTAHKLLGNNAIDSVEVIIHTDGLLENDNEFTRFLTEEEKINSLGAEVYKTEIITRIRLIAGLAFLSLFEGARMDIANGDMRAENIITSISSSGVAKFLKRKDRKILSKQTPVNLHQAVGTLWMYYPYEITGYDSKIKLMSLKMLSNQEKE